MRRLIPFFAVLALALPAAAQPLPDPEGAIVEELVVQALEPGPAWWRVSDADSTVYILGVAGDRMPAGVGWDQTFLEKRLTGANGLIVGTRVALTGKLRDIPALLKARAQLRSKTPLEESLDPALRARFVAAREKTGKPASRYAGWQPLVAGTLLLQDRGGKSAEPGVTETVLKLAKARKIKTIEPARYDAVPFMRSAMGSLTPAIHRQCLEAALTDIEAPAGRGAAAAKGWARGDVAAALSEPRSFEKCVMLLGGGATLWKRMVGDQAGAVAKALETPGHTVAIISLRPLLAEDGVVEQLQAKGLTVRGPGEAG